MISLKENKFAYEIFNITTMLDNQIYFSLTFETLRLKAIIKNERDVRIKACQLEKIDFAESK